MGDVFVWLLEMPCAIRGVTVVDENGNYNIYINSSLSYDEQCVVVEHEMYHAKNNHHYVFEPVEVCEIQTREHCDKVRYARKI